MHDYTTTTSLPEFLAEVTKVIDRLREREMLVETPLHPSARLQWWR